MANESPKPALGTLIVPTSYPTVPTPGKINLLWDVNKTQLYHKLSPYGYETFFGIKTRQPFFYTYPDEKSESNTYGIVDLFQHSVTDVKRIAKFMGSGPGLLFIGKQFLLQTGNAFNETRIWNPTSPILGAGLPLGLWAFRPQRNIDTSNLLGSLLGSAGASIGTIFSTAPTPPPAGTAGASALPTPSVAGGKGLLRAGTANAAKSTFQSIWAPPSTAGLGLGGWLSSNIKNLFGNFIPALQTGVSKRSDENAYGLMLGSYPGDTGPFSYQGATRLFSGPQQFWLAGGISDGTKGGIGTGNIRSHLGKNQSPLKEWALIYIDENGYPMLKKPSERRIQGLNGLVGFQLPSTTLGPVRYGDSVGNARPDDDWSNSNILLQQSYYNETDRKYPSKRTDKTNPSVIATTDSMKRVLKNISTRVLTTGVDTYTVTPDAESSILVSPNRAVIGYDRISAMKAHGDSETQYKYSVLQEYRKGVRVLEDQHTDDPIHMSMKMASSRQADYINQLNVLDGQSVRSDTWENWKPYRDDLIAFYFYDVVNDRYIPFRATIRGLQETDSVNWEELSFLGRADKLYSYGGYNRSLTFNFTVHISSITELAPTWQRINYLMSLVKPSNYTNAKQLSSSNTIPARFIVPPMVMITIGDLYRNQPVVIGSAGLTVPDSATWETLNTENSKEWSYLANYIKAPKIGNMYAQLPKTVEISITAYILEKERAIVGGAHFGHAPHSERYVQNEYRRTTPDFAAPNKFNKSLVVYQKQKEPSKNPNPTTS